MSGAASNLTIVPTFDSSITNLSDATVIEATINAAITALEADVTANAPVTVSIEFNNINTGLGQSLTPTADMDYSTYLADLRANTNQSTNDVTALATMPEGPNTGINGATQVLLTAADLAAIGDTADAASLVAGNSGFNSIISFNFSIINDSRPDANPDQYDLQAVATHEIDEVLGIGGNGSTLYQPDATPPATLPTDVAGLDFFRYSAPGVRSFTYDPTTSAYFSINGGTTELVYFNQQNGANGADLGDWGTPPPGSQSGNNPPQTQDAFGTPGSPTNLGANELTALDVVGWNLTPAGLVADGLSTTACYCPGTMIATPDGEMAIDNLAIGDFVLTASGDVRKIKWIGRRDYAGRFLRGNRDLWPVTVSAGALSDGAPNRDLHVSPLHAMLLDGVLVPASSLVNGVTIFSAPPGDLVEYIHLELETHDVILANGAASESFVDDFSRAMFHNAASFHELYPDEAEDLAAIYCAPRVTEGFALAAIRARLNVRAGLRAKTGAEPLRGHVDRVDGDVVEGWAQHPERPEAAVCLDIVVDGEVVARTLANMFRDDLRRAELGSGRHGFSVRLPAGLLPGRGVSVRRSCDGVALEGISRRLAA